MLQKRRNRAGHRVAAISLHRFCDDTLKSVSNYHASSDAGISEIDGDADLVASHSIIRDVRVVRITGAASKRGSAARRPHLGRDRAPGHGRRPPQLQRAARLAVDDGHLHQRPSHLHPSATFYIYIQREEEEAAAALTSFHHSSAGIDFLTKHDIPVGRLPS